MESFIFLGNAAWQLGPTSSGNAVVEFKKVPRTLAFKRVTSQQMISDLLPGDESNTEWVQGVISQEPITVRLPNNVSYTIPAANMDIGRAALKCIMKVVTQADPFAHSGGGSPPPPPSPPPPSAPSRDPFAAPAQ